MEHNENKRKKQSETIVVKKNTKPESIDESQNTDPGSESIEESLNTDPGSESNDKSLNTDPGSGNDTLTDAQKLLEAKSERLYGRDKKDEEEPEEEVEDTTSRKVKKKIGFFIDYYKWHVIIPVIIIVTALIMLFTYLDESRERKLELSIVNAAYEIPEVIYKIENDYVSYSPEIDNDSDVRIEINLQYPNISEIGGDPTQDEVIAMQRFNAMVVTGRVDVALTNTWVIKDYTVSDATLDLREIFDDEYLEEHKDILFYADDSKGEEIPVGFYVKDEVINEAYKEGYEPIVVSFDSSKHKDEAKTFMMWLIDASEQ